MREPLFACQICRCEISANFSRASWKDMLVRTLSGWGRKGWPSIRFSSLMFEGIAVLTEKSVCSSLQRCKYSLCSATILRA